MEKLTKRQKEALRCIEKYISLHGYPPTVREIQHMMNLSSPSTMQTHFKVLQKKGYITLAGKQSRTMVVHDPDNPYASKDEETDTESNNSGTAKLPLVGNVAAGQPILAEQNIEDYVSLPKSIVGDNASYLLEVHGTSMIEAGINNGDYVVVKEQSNADNGDIVVALVDDGATVKRFYKEQGHIRLQPENHTMKPIIVPDCHISGKVVALFRRVK